MSAKLMSTSLFLVALLTACGLSDSKDADKTLVGGEGLFPDSLAVKDGIIYFTDHGGSGEAGSVKKSTVGSNSSTKIGEAIKKPASIVTDGQHVWWVERESDSEGATIASTLRRVTVAGDAIETIASAAKITALTIDNLNVYFNDQATGEIYAQPLAGGTPALLHTAAKNVVTALAADGQFVYFTLAYDAPNGKIARLPVVSGAAAGAPQEIVNGLGAPFALAAAGTEICWRELQQGIIGCVAKEGGAATIYGVQQSFIPLSDQMLSLDAQAMYYPSGNEIRRLARGKIGQLPEVVVKAGKFVMYIDGVVIDETNLYWSEGTSLHQTAKSTRVANSSN